MTIWHGTRRELMLSREWEAHLSLLDRPSSRVVGAYMCLSAGNNKIFDIFDRRLLTISMIPSSCDDRTKTESRASNMAAS